MNHVLCCDFYMLLLVFQPLPPAGVRELSYNIWSLFYTRCSSWYNLDWNRQPQVYKSAALKPPSHETDNINQRFLSFFKEEPGGLVILLRLGISQEELVVSLGRGSSGFLFWTRWLRDPTTWAVEDGEKTTRLLNSCRKCFWEQLTFSNCSQKLLKADDFFFSKCVVCQTAVPQCKDWLLAAVGQHRLRRASSSSQKQLKTDNCLEMLNFHRSQALLFERTF